MKSAAFLRSALAMGIFTLVVTNSFAQEPTKREKLANDLLEQMHMEKTMDSAFDSVFKMQDQMMTSQGMTSEQKDKFHKRMQGSMETVKKELSWDKIKAIFVKIYADNFDEGDLEGMIAFYKTPVGQKFIQKQPQIQAETMQAMQQIMPKIQAAIVESFKDADADETKSTP